MDAGLRGAALIAIVAVGCDRDDAPIDRAASLPEAAICDAVRDWDETAVALEGELVAAIDDARARATSCGALGRAAAAESPLRHDGALRCAARVHAAAMAEQDFFGHEDPDGVTAWQRIAAAGYPTVLATEVIAMGELAPARLVHELWLPSDPHCGALVAAEWVDIGVGRFARAEPPPDDDTPAPTWWVVVLATPDPLGMLP